MRRARVWRGGFTGLWYVERFSSLGSTRTARHTHAAAIKVASLWVRHGRADL